MNMIDQAQSAEILPLAIGKERSRAKQNLMTEVTELPLPRARCLSREQAADYLGIGVTLFSALDIPCVKFGRRSVFDRIDLDDWLEHYKRRGRAGKETLWLEKLESTKGAIHDSYGLTLPSPTASAYDKALGLKAAKKPKRTSPS